MFRCVLSNKSWSVVSVTVFVGSELRIFDCPVVIRAHYTSCLTLPNPHSSWSGGISSGLSGI